MKVEPDCPVCSVPCDSEIHAATERIHAAMRERIERYLEPIAAKAPKTPKTGHSPVRCLRSHVR